MRPSSLFSFAPILIALFLTAIRVLGTANPPVFQADWVAPSDPVYVGERFYLTLEVVSREGSLAKNIRLDGLPSSNRLVCESFADLPVEIKAIEDRICEIRRFRTIAALQQPGPCEIHVSLQGTQIRKIQNYFFTQREERPVSLSATPITLNAIPLPEANRPPFFEGAIGTGFALSAQIAPTSAVIGDLITVSIRLQTDNPLATPSLPITPHLPDFKTYPLKTELLPDNPQIRAFSQIVIPLSDQARTWGPVAFAYFDPRRGVYEILNQGPFDLILLPERPLPVADYRPSPSPSSGSTPRPPIRPLRISRYPGFQEFADLYAQGQFSEALNPPMSADNTDFTLRTDELYNRGCAWLASGMSEKAAAIFRAGLYRDPRAADLREGFLQATLLLASAPPRGSFIARLWDHATLREWTMLLGLGLFLGGTGFWIRRWPGYRTGIGTGLFILALLVLPLATGGIRFRKDLIRYPEAILTPASTPVSMAPAESAQRYTHLPRGVWIRIREINGDWIRISTESVTGWIPAASAERIISGKL
jgi:hypothetical protein